MSWEKKRENAKEDAEQKIFVFHEVIFQFGFYTEKFISVGLQSTVFARSGFCFIATFVKASAYFSLSRTFTKKAQEGSQPLAPLLTRFTINQWMSRAMSFFDRKTSFQDLRSWNEWNIITYLFSSLELSVARTILFLRRKDLVAF